MSNPSLLVLRGGLTEASLPIRSGTTVGRDPSVQLRLGEHHEQVGRRQFQFHSHAGGWQVEHVGRTNATIVDGVELATTGARAELRNGSTIRVGTSEFRVEIPPPPVEDVPAATAILRATPPADSGSSDETAAGPGPDVAAPRDDTEPQPRPAAGPPNPAAAAGPPGTRLQRRPGPGKPPGPAAGGGTPGTEIQRRPGAGGAPAADSAPPDAPGTRMQPRPGGGRPAPPSDASPPGTSLQPRPGAGRPPAPAPGGGQPGTRLQPRPGAGKPAGRGPATPGSGTPPRPGAGEPAAPSDGGDPPGTRLQPRPGGGGPPNAGSQAGAPGTQMQPRPGGGARTPRPGPAQPDAEAGREPPRPAPQPPRQDDFVAHPAPRRDAPSNQDANLVDSVDIRLPPRHDDAPPAATFLKPRVNDTGQGGSAGDLSALQACQPRLYCASGVTSELIPIDSAQFTIGSADSVHLPLQVHDVAARHAEIRFQSGGFAVFDQSTGGTLRVDDEDVDVARQLASDGLLQIGPVEALFTCVEPGTETERRRFETRVLDRLRRTGKLSANHAKQIQNLARTGFGPSLTELVLLRTTVRPRDWWEAAAAVRGRSGGSTRWLLWLGIAVVLAGAGAAAAFLL